eukprot:scaffold31312_cov79-Isochrysis_galbana.AAC.1
MEPTFNTLIAPFAEPAPPPPPTPEPPPAEPAPAPESLVKHLTELLTEPPANSEPPKLTRQNASVDPPPPKKERPIPEMQPLVPLPKEWMRALEEADPKELQPLEAEYQEECCVPGGLDPNTVLVIACIVVGGVWQVWDAVGEHS